MRGPVRTPRAASMGGCQMAPRLFSGFAARLHFCALIAPFVVVVFLRLPWLRGFAWGVAAFQEIRRAPLAVPMERHVRHQGRSGRRGRLGLVDGEVVPPGLCGGEGVARGCWGKTCDWRGLGGDSAIGMRSGIFRVMPLSNGQPKCMNQKRPGTKAKGVAPKCNPLFCLAPRPGLEPGTHGLTVRCSTD